MTAGDATPGRRGGRAHALLAAALLAVTTLVKVPVDLYGATTQDFSSASRDVVLAIFAAGLAFFLVLASSSRGCAPGRAGSSQRRWSASPSSPGSGRGSSRVRP